MQFNVLGKDNAAEIISRSLPPSDECVYMCIGTEQILSDSLGPRVGLILMEQEIKPLFVYGYTGSNINALNLLKAYRIIKLLHPDKKVVVIDAAVGDTTEVGSVQIMQGGTAPGAATNKNLPNIGDYSILGIVGMKGLKDFYVTSYDREKLLEYMSKVIAEAIMA